MNSLTLNELAAAVQGTLQRVPDPNAAFFQVNLDSRSIAPGDLFWAINGEKHNGHNFTAAAIRRGAVACVIDQQACTPETVNAIVVDDTQAALTRLSQWHRNTQVHPTVIGVTGSVGKTTTRNLIHTVLNTTLQGSQSPANYNNHFGVPLSLLEINPGDAFAVLELGASGVGEIRPLANLIQPTIGVITAIAPVHLEGFGSIENIAKTKRELFDSLPANGIAIVNGDDPMQAQLTAGLSAKVIRVGEQPDNDLRATNIELSHTGFTFEVNGDRYHVPVMARHLIISCLAAIAVAREFGLSLEEINTGFEQFRPLKGRGKIQSIGPWTVIDETYNASPIAVEAACNSLATWNTPSRKIAILGEMLELGPNAAEFHRQLGKTIAGMDIELLITSGHLASLIATGAAEAGMNSRHILDCPDRDSVCAVLETQLQNDDVILIKGSRGNRLEQIIHHLEETERRMRFLNSLSNHISEASRVGLAHH